MPHSQLMPGTKEPEENSIKKQKKRTDEDKIQKLDGYACPYPRRKLSALNDY